MSLRLAFDATEAFRPRPQGMGRYCDELLRALAKNPRVELTLFCRSVHRPVVERLAVWGSPRCGTFFRRRRFGVEADLWHGPANRLLYRGSLPSVLTLHDVAPQLGYARDRRRQLARETARAAAVITPSLHSARGISAQFGLPDGMVRVIHWAPPSGFEPRPSEDVEEVCGHYGLRPGRYILHLGSRVPRKNPRAIFGAPRGLLEEFDLDLAVSGEPLAGEGELTDPLGGRIRHLGYPENLPALYTGAAALLFPSFEEGYGFPAVEALACGCPAVLARAGALPEVAGEAASYCDPESVEDVRRALRRVLEDTAFAESLRRLGLEMTRRSWADVADDHLKLYDEITNLTR
ncbi:MAG TPA: glycosyltransferase family 1 protein [bacterium]|nr:glycosyltransferase family 1 protein [bacterium]